MKFSKETRQTAYQTLSPEAQEFVSSDENIKVTELLAKKAGLDDEKSNLLDSEVYHTMIGLESVDELTRELESSLGLSHEKISELVNDLKNQIFNQLEAIKNGTTKETPDRFVQTPTSLKSTESQAPSNLPAGEVTEETIQSSVGSPGEKLAWEQRKQIAANALPKADGRKYNGVDPYREPLG